MYPAAFSISVVLGASVPVAAVAVVVALAKDSWSTSLSSSSDLWFFMIVSILEGRVVDGLEAVVVNGRVVMDAVVVVVVVAARVVVVVVPGVVAVKVAVVSPRLLRFPLFIDLELFEGIFRFAPNPGGVGPVGVRALLL